MRLSICIPTYNRGPQIGELIDSIINQKGQSCEVEIVISDNASTDQTQTVVEAYRDRVPGLIYVRAANNMGADWNFLNVVKLATGDFCWLMGSDDRLEPGSIAEIERHCRENPNLSGLSVNRNAYNYAMDRRIHERPVANNVFSRDTLISGVDNIFRDLGEYFGYLSGQVIRRDLWEKVVENDNVEDYFNAYVHIYIIGRMLQSNPYWFYVRYPCVGWRSGNDSFLSEGELKRMKIDVLGYEKIARGLFGEQSSTYRHINSTIACVHVRYAIMGAKLKGLPSSFFGKAGLLLVKSYWRYPQFWIRTAPLFLIPGPAMRLIRWGYRNTLKRARTKRLAA